MNTHPVQLYGDNFLVDNSFISEFCTCPRKAAYRYLQKRRQVKPRAALFFGGAIHKALETRARHREQFCTHELEEEMVNALCKAYEGVDFESDYRNLNYAINTIQKYNEIYRFDQLIPILIDSQPAVEIPFALPVGELFLHTDLLITDPDRDNGTPYQKFIDTINVVLTGKIDRVCEYQGGLYIMDHKTTSIGGPTFFSEFYTSLQFRGYKWAVEQLLGQRIAGVIIDGIVCRPPKVNGEVNYTFDRQVIPLHDSMITEWQTTFMIHVQNWFKQITNQRYHNDPIQAFPLHTGSCMHKYGVCEYFDVCQLPLEQRSSMISTPLYEDHSWSPLEEEGKPNQPKPQPDLEQLFQ